MKSPRLSFLLVLCAILILTACSGKSTNVEADRGDGSSSGEGKPKVLRVLYATVEAGSEAIIAAANKYESETGIDIEVDTFPYNNLQEKLFSELAQKSDYYDVFAVDTPWVPTIIQHLEPLSEYMRNTKSPDRLKLDDFIAKAFLDTSVFKLDKPHENPPQMDVIDLDKINSEEFDVWSLPIQSNVLTVSYRKDLFENAEFREQFKQEYGRELDIPQTLDEYLEVAKFFTRDMDNDGNIDLYGTTLMARKHEANFVDFKSFLSNFGGSIFDENLKPIFNNEVGVKALETYGSWINEHKVTPPGVLTYTWDEVATVFGSGQVAMGMNYHDMKLDPKVEGGKTGYFVFPGVENNGNIVRGPHFGSWGVGINKYSKNKQAAYELVEYLTSPDVQIEYLNFNQHVTRISAYEASANFENEQTREYYQVLGESLNIGVGRPRITNYDQVSEVVQIAVSEYLFNKKSAKEALDEAAMQVEKLMEQAGYYQ
jgi:ABC-type sugar transport system, periplasmic component